VKPKLTLLSGLIFILGLPCAQADHPVPRELRKPGVEPEVYNVEENHKEMRAAVQQARRTVGQFITALQHRFPEQQDFEVKKPFVENGHVEHIWLADVTFSGNRFHGIVDNHPHFVKGVKYGDRVSVNPDEISDWAYLDSNNLVGGYTIKAHYKGLSPERRKELEHELTFNIGK
jgi:uncharacterized protein YegJ (DUF2314 family)